MLLFVALSQSSHYLFVHFAGDPDFSPSFHCSSLSAFPCFHLQGTPVFSSRVSAFYHRAGETHRLLNAGSRAVAR